VRLRAASAADAATWVRALQKYGGGAADAARAGPGAAHPRQEARAGWSSAEDGQGRTYYYNKATGARSWQPPEEVTKTAPAAWLPPGAYSRDPVPVYSPSHDPVPVFHGPSLARDPHNPPAAAGPRVLELYIRQPGFFGVSLDEVHAAADGRADICVQGVEPGSEAHKQCPQLEPGMYVRTVNSQAVGGLRAGAATAMLRSRPLAMTFAYAVDHATAQADADAEAEVARQVELTAKQEAGRQAEVARADRLVEEGSLAQQKAAAVAAEKYTLAEKLKDQLEKLQATPLPVPAPPSTRSPRPSPYLCDATFRAPVGEPLGITLGEYPSRHDAHFNYLVLTDLTASAGREFPQLEVGLYILQINGRAVAAMASSEAQRELLRRPLTVTFIDGIDGPAQIDRTVQAAAELALAAKAIAVLPGSDGGATAAAQCEEVVLALKRAAKDTGLVLDEKEFPTLSECVKQLCSKGFQLKHAAEATAAVMAGGGAATMTRLGQAQAGMAPRYADSPSGRGRQQLQAASA
jgi:hypothetical protein